MILFIISEFNLKFKTIIKLFCCYLCVGKVKSKKYPLSSGRKLLNQRQRLDGAQRFNPFSNALAAKGTWRNHHLRRIITIYHDNEVHSSP